MRGPGGALALASALVALALVMTPGEARAEPYLVFGGLTANLSDTGVDNTGWVVSTGYDFGEFRGEVEASRHTHLGRDRLGVTAMAYVEPWTSGRITPYIGAGGGSTFTKGRFDEPLIQGSAGITFAFNDRLGGLAAISKRCYGSLADFCASRDMTALVGLRWTFENE